jgi:hypothetical protein
VSTIDGTVGRCDQCLVGVSGNITCSFAGHRLIWLATADIEDKRARARAAEAGKSANTRQAPGRLVEGAGVHGWKQALNALEIYFPSRIPIDAR